MPGLKGQESDGQLPKGTSKLDFIPLEWQSTILKLKMQGKANHAIVKYMWDTYKFKTNVVSLGRWLRNRTDMAPSLMFKREAYVNELQTQYTEVLKEFQKMNEYTWKLLKDVHEQAKLGSIKEKSEELRFIAEIRAQIELANALMGALPKSDQQIEDTAKSVSRALRELDKMGLLNKVEQVKAEERAKSEKRIEESPYGRDVEIELPGEAGSVIVKKRVGIDLIGVG